MLGVRDFEHRLVLVRVEREADCGDAGDAVEAEHLVEFAAGGLDPGDQRLEPFVVVQLRRNRLERARVRLSDTESISRANPVAA